VRHTIATSLLTRARQEGRESDEEILAAIGYQSTDEYWSVAMSEPTQATTFAHKLAMHQTDPTEQLNEFNPISRVHALLYAALNLALKSRQKFFIGTPRSLKDAMLDPRAAVLWLLSLPKRRGLVPPGLRRYLQPEPEPLKSRRAPPAPQRPPGIVERITQYVRSLPSKQTEAEYRAAAEKDIINFTDQEWREAFSKVSPEHKRARGETLNPARKSGN
jgi:hypothetical protein